MFVFFGFGGIFQNLSNKDNNSFTIDDLEKLIKYDKNHNNYIDLNRTTYNGRTYLTSLNNEMDQKLFSALIKFGINPNVQDKYGIYPLQYAFYICNSNLIRILIKSGKIDYNKRIPDVNIEINKEKVDNKYYHINSNLPVSRFNSDCSFTIF